MKKPGGASKEGDFLKLEKERKPGAWQEFSRRARYGLDKVFARGPSAQFLLLLLLTMAVVAVGCIGAVIGLFSEANKDVGGIPKDWGKGIWDTIWWSLNLVLDAGSFTGNYGATVPVILLAFLVTLMGMVIFGLFIGFVTTAVEERLEVLRRGDSEVIEQGHILLLGFSPKLFAVMNLLSEVEEKAAFVILADHEMEDMQAALRLHLRKGIKNSIILRKGEPSSLVELERVAFNKARSIILLAEEDVEEGVNPDINVIKALLLLGSYEGWGDEKPKIVAEILGHENAEVAGLAGGRDVPLVVTGDLVSKLLVQTSRLPGLSSVYEELFCFEGSELYIHHVPQAVGRTMEDVLCRMPTAVPIGLAWTETVNGQEKLVTFLNPAKDRVVGPKEDLILLAEDENISFETSGETFRSKHTLLTPQKAGGRERVLVLGYSPSLPAVLAQFDSYMSPGTPVVVVCALSDEEARGQILEEVGGELKNLVLTIDTDDYLKRQSLEEHLTPDLTCLVLLADTSYHDDHPDGRTLMAAVMLRELQREGKFGERTQLVAEILDPDNRDLLQLTNIFDILVSPEITSMLLAQLSRQPGLIDVFGDMLDADGVEVYLKPASRYLPLGVDLSFRDILHAALCANEMAMGVLMRESMDTPFEVVLNPPKDTIFTLGPFDRLVVLAEDLYDAEEDGIEN